MQCHIQHLALCNGDRGHSRHFKTHINLTVAIAGFRISKERPYIGVSCDGYVSCTCCVKGVLEAKCPFKWANNPTINWTEDGKGHLGTLFSLKKNHSYYTQVHYDYNLLKKRKNLGIDVNLIITKINICFTVADADVYLSCKLYWLHNLDPTAKHHLPCCKRCGFYF